MRNSVWMPISVFKRSHRPGKMNSVSVVIASLFAVLSAIFIILLVVAIVRNLKDGKRYRQGMAGQLSRLRLARMLGVHRIDQNTYLHTQPVLSIRDQMKHCAECTHTEQCDKLLDEGVGDQSGFCQNDEALRKVRETPGPAS